MLFHASIPARDPEHVATVLAEVWRGRVLPFAAAPGTFVVTAGEGPEIHIEVTAAARTTLPPDQPGAVKLAVLDPLVGTPVRLGVPREEADLHRIARAAGWRSRTARREGAFRVVELWLENWFMLEALTPTMQAEYRAALERRVASSGFVAMCCQRVRGDIN